eukprot:941407-Rhodomonas_salina.1
MSSTPGTAASLSQYRASRTEHYLSTVSQYRASRTEHVQRSPPKTQPAVCATNRCMHFCTGLRA